MAKRNKTIITCTLTGTIHTPTMFNALPYTADDIDKQAVAAPDDVRQSLDLKNGDKVSF